MTDIDAIIALDGDLSGPGRELLEDTVRQLDGVRDIVIDPEHRRIRLRSAAAGRIPERVCLYARQLGLEARVVRLDPHAPGAAPAGSPSEQLPA